MKIQRTLPAQSKRMSSSVVTDMSFAFGAVVGLFIVIFRYSILPAKFSNDSSHIQALALGIANANDDESYSNVASIYRSLGLAEHPLLAGLFGFTLFFSVMWIVFRRVRSFSTAPMTGILIFLAMALAAVFIGTYSKDVFILPLVGVLFVLRRGWWAEFLILGGMTAYALVFRDYWFLVAGLYFAFRFIRYPRVQRGTNIVLVIVALAIASMSIFLFLGQNPDYFRVSVNLNREGSDDASTLIRPFVDAAQPLSGTINVIITFFALQFPFPLLLLGGLYYVILGVVISMLWASFIVATNRYRHWDLRSREYRIDRSIALVIAFLCVQALFEPDYGSALRHVTPLIPLVVYVVASTLGNRNRDANSRPELLKVDLP